MVEIRLKKNNSVCEFRLDFNEIKLPDDVNILKDLEKETENSIYHLKRSNEEIKEFDPEGNDKDLFLALNENKFALSRKEERLRLIRSKIQNIESLCDSGNAKAVQTYLLNSKNEDAQTDVLDDTSFETDDKNISIEKYDQSNDSFNNENGTKENNTNHIPENTDQRDSQKSLNLDGKNGIYL
ncbi:conserved Plasmodium protein, unknown function [Plasmodium chabaudi adami]|uniref:Uncharacterized protein n=2 Tax=Plasmodium chabaudi TaxID=5825 RepID=A0A1C6Y8N8_PLACE|nr:conserved Plasmodium protein, unknown function [Plasmodium chabaudi adami]SCM19893.1 conserved Plasmodium protein, unknown function [Plasmodium chabaudi chabaudi]SCN59134.1 conserved Plasmodium protein, unknown function [Plasmodium chabaudi adami]